VTSEEFDFAVDINLKGAFFVAQAAVDLLKRAEGKGSIIFTASISASWALHSAALLDDQGRDRAADEVVGSRACTRHPVQCDLPGPVDTPMLPQFFGREPGANVADLMQGFLSVVPLGRPPSPRRSPCGALPRM